MNEVIHHEDSLGRLRMAAAAAATTTWWWARGLLAGGDRDCKRRRQHNSAQQYQGERAVAESEAGGGLLNWLGVMICTCY
jgi:hypothetical protein